MKILRIMLLFTLFSSLLLMGCGNDLSKVKKNIVQEKYEEISQLVGAQQLIKSFYENVGDWAGAYELDKIDRIRYVQSPKDPNQIIAHVRYHYQCINPARCNRDEGYDQRTFTFNYENSKWTIIDMGEHQSATFK